MTWEKAKRSGKRDFLNHINKEKGLKYHSMSRNEIAYEGKLLFGEHVKNSFGHSVSLIIGDSNNIFLPFLDEDRVTEEEIQRDPDFPYYTRQMTFLGLNQFTFEQVKSGFKYSKHSNLPHFTITGDHEHVQKYFDIISDAYFEVENIYFKEGIISRHRCTAFTYICPETGKEFIKENPYL